MIEILLSILILQGLVFIYFMRKMINKLTITKDFPSFDKFINPIVDDIIQYAVNKDLLTCVMPDSNNHTTLFAQDAEKNEIIVICPIIQTDAKKGSRDYDIALQEMKDRVDAFIENRGKNVRN